MYLFDKSDKGTCLTFRCCLVCLVLVNQQVNFMSIFFADRKFRNVTK